MSNTLTLINNTSEKIYVSATATGGETLPELSEAWYDVTANGGKNTWTRDKKQVIRFARSLTPGVLVETVLGVPGTTVNIY